jgi:phage shock protein C
MANKKLYRDVRHSSIGGVASGLADFFEMDVTIFRVLFVITAIFGGGVLIYVILWIIVPPKPITIEPEADHVAEPIIVEQAEPVKDLKYVDNKKRGITGGLILIVIGIIFLINIFTDFEFRDLWPVLVITLGVIIVVSGFVSKKS